MDALVLIPCIPIPNQNQADIGNIDSIHKQLIKPIHEDLRWYGLWLQGRDG